MGVATISSLHLLAQLNLSDAFSDVGGIRFITGFTMLVHMFWAELFVGFALAAPVLQAWGARTGSPRMDRLAHSMARFNVLTFSTGRDLRGPLRGAARRPLPAGDGLALHPLLLRHSPRHALHGPRPLGDVLLLLQVGPLQRAQQEASHRARVHDGPVYLGLDGHHDRHRHLHGDGRTRRQAALRPRP